MAYPKSENEWQQLLSKHDIELIGFSLNESNNDTILTMLCGTCKTLETNSAINIRRRKKTPCLKCSKREPYTTDSIKMEISLAGGTYLGGEVTGKYSTVRMQCPTCDREIEKTAHDIRRSPKTCKHCRLLKSQATRQKKLNNLGRAHRIAKIRGGKCLTFHGPVKASDKVLWQCKFGHEWESTINSVICQKTWCPDCAISRGERTIRVLLEECFKQPFPQAKPDWLYKTQMHLDGYNQGLKIAFECQGRQHYEFTKQFHKTDEDLIHQKERDKRKAELCAQNGVKLLVVPYWIINDGLDALKNHIHIFLREANLRTQIPIQEVQLDEAKIFDKSRDHDFKKFSEIVKDKEGTFETSNYLGVAPYLPIRCKHGHIWQAQPYLVLKGHWCPVCANILPIGLQKIRDKLQQMEWRLGKNNNVYKNAHQTLNLLCPNGHSVRRTWNKWQQGVHSCLECKKEAAACEFLQKMKERGYEIEISIRHFRGAKQKIYGTCMRCGDRRFLSVEAWKRITSCSSCGQSNEPYHPCHCKN